MSNDEPTTKPTEQQPAHAEMTMQQKREAAERERQQRAMELLQQRRVLKAESNKNNRRLVELNDLADSALNRRDHEAELKYRKELAPLQAREVEIAAAIDDLDFKLSRCQPNVQHGGHLIIQAGSQYR